MCRIIFSKNLCNIVLLLIYLSFIIIYQVEEKTPQAPQPTPSEPPPVRRSERPVRRRVSSTYEYEDADLYIDEAPPPTRRRAPRNKQTRHGGQRTGV